MRKLLILFVVVLLFKPPLVAQTPVWEETFLENPPGWTLDDNWSLTTGKLVFDWTPIIINYDLSAISPVISLPESVEELIISQYLLVYMYSVTTEQCEISIIVEGEENIVWTYECINGDWGSSGGSDISFPISDYGGQDIQIKFRTWGPTTDAWYNWDVYNMAIMAYLDNDLVAKEVAGPNNIDIGQPGNWEVKVKNLGLLPQSDFTVKLFSYQSGEEIGSMNSSETLNPGESAGFNFNWTSDYPHNTCLYGVVLLEGDEFEDNNYSRSYFVRIEPDLEYNILVWDNDNGNSTVYNIESGEYEECHIGLTSSLSKAGISYDLVSYLPNDLSLYDIVLSTMGCYCLS